MVKEENARYHIVNKFVVSFLNTSEFATPELIQEWKKNANRLKNALRKTDKPQLPTGVRSAYIYYCEMMRPIIKEEMRVETGHDKIDIHKVTCELGRRWRQFKQAPDPDMNKRITELANSDNKRYYTEKEAMQKKKKPHNNNHLTSMYLFYSRELREKNPKITMSNIALLWASNKHDAKLADRFEAAKKLYQEQKERDQREETSV